MQLKCRSQRYSVPLAYAAPVVPVVLITGSINVIQGIYAKHYDLSLTAISGALLIAGLFDAFTDPAIGYLSDRQRARTGTRRAFVVGGALAFPVCAFFLFVPVVDPTLWYFLFWYLAFYLALTVFTIPHLAWGGDAATDAPSRNRIFSFRAFAGYMGFLVFSVIPLLPITDTSEITPETLRITVFVACLLLVPAIIVFAKNVPDGQFIRAGRTPEHPLRALLSLRRNPLFIPFICGFALYGLSAGVGWALIFVVIDSYLGLGASYVYLYLLHLIVSSISVVASLKLIARLDKKRSYLLAISLSALAYMLWPLILTGGPWSLYIAAAFMALMGPASAIGGVVSSSLLADIIDYERLRARVDRSAISFGVMNLGAKTMNTLGMSAAFWIAAYSHFDPTAAQQTVQVYWGLAIAMGVLPTFLCLASMAFIARVNMTERRHAVIRKRLMQREMRAGTAEQSESSMGGNSV